MKVIDTILKSLSTADSQNRDWYAWATNQCSHALFGVFVALLFPAAPFQMVFIFALMKEMVDLARELTLDTLKDSSIDITFWLIGASVIALPDPMLGMFFTLFALIIGVVPRARKVLK